MKACSKCAETKPIDAFYPSKNNKDGRHGSCKQCWNAAAKARSGDRSAYMHDYYEKNRDRILRVNRVWAECNAVVVREVSARASRRNTERLSDSYVRLLLGMKAPDAPKALVELKRIQMMVAREAAKQGGDE